MNTWKHLSLRVVALLAAAVLLGLTAACKTGRTGYGGTTPGDPGEEPVDPYKPPKSQ